jgi:hypothetical protein
MLAGGMGFDDYRSARVDARRRPLSFKRRRSRWYYATQRGRLFRDAIAEKVFGRSIVARHCARLNRSADYSDSDYCSGIPDAVARSRAGAEWCAPAVPLCWTAN